MLSSSSQARERAIAAEGKIPTISLQNVEKASNASWTVLSTRENFVLPQIKTHVTGNNVEYSHSFSTTTPALFSSVVVVLVQEIAPLQVVAMLVNNIHNVTNGSVKSHIILLTSASVSQQLHRQVLAVGVDAVVG